MGCKYIRNWKQTLARFVFVCARSLFLSLFACSSLLYYHSSLSLYLYHSRKHIHFLCTHTHIASCFEVTHQPTTSNSSFPFFYFVVYIVFIHIFVYYYYCTMLLSTDICSAKTQIIYLHSHTLTYSIALAFHNIIICFLGSFLFDSHSLHRLVTHLSFVLLSHLLLFYAYSYSLLILYIAHSGYSCFVYQLRFILVDLLHQHMKWLTVIIMSSLFPQVNLIWLSHSHFFLPTQYNAVKR